MIRGKWDHGASSIVDMTRGVRFTILLALEKLEILCVEMSKRTRSPSHESKKLQ